MSTTLMIPVSILSYQCTMQCPVCDYIQTAKVFEHCEFRMLKHIKELHNQFYTEISPCPV